MPCKTTFYPEVAQKILNKTYLEVLQFKSWKEMDPSRIDYDYSTVYAPHWKVSTRLSKQQSRTLDDLKGCIESAQSNVYAEQSFLAYYGLRWNWKPTYVCYHNSIIYINPMFFFLTW